MAEDLEEERFKDMARHRIRGAEEAAHASEVVKRFVATHTADEIYRGAQALKFPWGIVRSPEENLEDPHFAEDRGVFQYIEHPEFGEGVSFRYVGRPYVFKDTPWNGKTPPLLAEHTKSVLQNDLNYSQTDIRRLINIGVVAVR